MERDKRGPPPIKLFKMGDDFVHPYIPNSVPNIKKKMLEEIGASSAAELYAEMIPDRLLLKRSMDLPEALPSELDLKRHIEAQRPGKVPGKFRVPEPNMRAA